MQPGALLSSFGKVVSPTSGRCLASFGKPLAVLAVLTVGAILFSGAAALLGARQPASLFHAAAEGVASDPDSTLHALPVHQPTAERTTALDDLIAGLKEGAFGVTFAQATIEAMAASPNATLAAAALMPTVLVDGERPPLRIEIMGFEGVAIRNPAPARSAQP